jgi:hypothetical protein
MSPPFSGSEYKPSKKPALKQVTSRATCLPPEDEDGGDMLLRNFGFLSTGYTALFPKNIELFRF